MIVSGSKFHVSRAWDLEQGLRRIDHAWRGVETLRNRNAEDSGLRLWLAVGVRGEMGEEILETKAALQAPLADIDLGIHLKDGEREGRL